MQIAYRFHNVNGIKLHVFHAGLQHNKVIVLLHGFPEFHHGWKNQINFLVGKGYHVVVPDQRGYGDSDKPKGIMSYVLDELVEDIVQLIRNITKDKVMLVGHDWGGGVAWTLAEHHPELLHKLIILNMPHIQVMKNTLISSSEQRKRSWYAAFFQLPKLPEFFLSLVNFRLLEMSLIKSSNPGTFSDQDLFRYKRAWQKTENLTSMLNWYRAFFFHKLEVKKEITIPVLIIWGAKDRALSVQMAYESIKKCTDGKLIVLDDLTHWLHHEDPERVNGLMGDF
jgi:epoxide hydrolase 4